MGGTTNTSFVTRILESKKIGVNAMIQNSSNNKLLDTYLCSFDIETSEEQRELLLAHLDLVVEKNRVMNLTRIVEAQDAIVLHVVDSLLMMPSLKHCGVSAQFSFLDIGTGAGFPGIPLGIVSGGSGLLIDSVGKKIRAVEEFIAALQLQEHLAARSVRVEELAKEQASSFDVVTARAVAELGVLVEYATPLLKKNGHLIVSKANISESEFAQGSKTAEICGLHYVSRETYELPQNLGHREIITYERVRGSKVKLPRQTGMAKHHPLVPSK